MGEERPMTAEALQDGFYCGQCKKFVLVENDVFLHPDLGKQECLTCRKCGRMVQFIEVKGKYAV